MERMISLNTFQARQARYRGLPVVPGIIRLLKLIDPIMYFFIIFNFILFDAVISIPLALMQ